MYAQGIGDPVTVASYRAAIYKTFRTPPFDFFAGHPNAHRVLWPTTSPPTAAPVSCTWRRPSGEEGHGRGRRQRHRGGAAARSGRKVPRAGAAVRGPDGLRRQPGDHQGPQGCGQSVAPRDHRALLPALVAVGSAADLHGGAVVVRGGDPDQAAHAGAESGDHVVAVAYPRRPVRQVARGCPRLEHQPQPVLGCAIPVWVSDDPEFPRVDVYGSLDELEGDFGVRPTNLHRPYIDELTRPNPDDRRAIDDAPGSEVLDCWFESGSMPYAQVHYPFQNKGWFDGDTSSGRYRTIRATSSSNTTGRPVAGSTICTCWPPRCSTGPRSRASSPTASFWG